MRMTIAEAERAARKRLLACRVKECRETRKHFASLVAAVRQHLAAVDTEFKEPGNPPERGNRIAKLCNALEYANDFARHFGLGEKL